MSNQIMKTPLCSISQQSVKSFVAIELSKLQLAYPNQLKDLEDVEVAALTALWCEVLHGVKPEVLHKAVIQYIRDDVNGFFPVPGQILAIAKTLDLSMEYSGYGRE